MNEQLDKMKAAILRIKDRSSCQDFVRTIISFRVAARPEACEVFEKE